jgi:hypothetical protein
MDEGLVEQQKHSAVPAVGVLGRDEMNFAEFPLALLTDRAPSDLKTLEAEDQIYDERKGQLVSRKLTITSSDKYGLTTPKDEDVLLALIQLTKEANNFTDRRVSFSRAELLKLLGWPRTGTSYERMRLAFCRWSTVFFLYENSWWENRRQSFESQGFNIIDNFRISDGRQSSGPDGQLEFPFSTFSWNENVFASFQAGYLKKLDFEFYLRLRHATSKRMYRFLDKRFHHSSTLKFDLNQLAFEKIGLSRTYTDSGKVKEKLQPAIEELTEAGFLEPMSREERFTKLGRGQWSITFVRRAPKVEGRASKLEPAGLEKALIERGVTPATAAELAAGFAEEHIQQRIEAFDWLVGKKDKRVSKSPGGYLADSIRKGYTTPKGFESKADREAREAAEEEKRRKVKAAKERAEAAEKAREEAEQARTRAYWDSLSGPEQEALRAEALSKANPLFHQRYRQNQKNPDLAERYLKIILDAHITALLDQGGPAQTSG